MSLEPFLPDLPPELSFYRDRTVALLRRYERLSVEVGRLPSLFGREYFRARVTSYRPTSFEDIVVFVHDIERSLRGLDPRLRFMLERIVLQDYTDIEVARELHVSERRVRDLYHDALDSVSQAFLARGILRPQDASAPRRRGHITFQTRRRRVPCIQACVSVGDGGPSAGFAIALVNPSNFIVSCQAAQP